MKKASDILKEAATVIEERGKLRDKDDGERSMSRAVQAYTALRGERMCGELDGWLFLCVLKLARATAGKPHLDDWTDLAGYAALAAEYVSNDTSQFWVEHALENGVSLRTQEEIDAYAKETEAKWETRKEALNELTRISEEMGLYDNEKYPYVTERGNSVDNQGKNEVIVPSGNVESKDESERCNATEQSEPQVSDDWIKWEGGECPADLGQRVEVRFRCGEIDGRAYAGEWFWEWEGSPNEYDIIAYRVVKD